MFEIGQRLRLTTDHVHAYGGAKATVHADSIGEVVQVKEESVQLQFYGLAGLTIEVPADAASAQLDVETASNDAESSKPRRAKRSKTA